MTVSKTVGATPEQIVVRAVWALWFGFFLVWLTTSIVVYARYGDLGSFIGGGVVVGALGVGAAVVTFVLRQVPR